jgi:hypothetical protein
MISEADGIQIIKMEFRVNGTKESAKTSGNRCVVAWNIENQTVAGLLIYSKTDIPIRNETAAWKSLIRKNYPEYSNLE